MGKGTWSCVMVGKYKVKVNHRRSLVFSNSHICLVIRTELG